MNEQLHTSNERVRWMNNYIRQTNESDERTITYVKRTSPMNEQLHTSNEQVRRTNNYIRQTNKSDERTITYVKRTSLSGLLPLYCSTNFLPCTRCLLLPAYTPSFVALVWLTYTIVRLSSLFLRRTRVCTDHNWKQSDACKSLWSMQLWVCLVSNARFSCLVCLSVYLYF